MMYPVIQTSPPPLYQGTQKMPPLHFYLYDDVTEPVNYCELVYTLDYAAEGDIIHLHLATGGGDMESAIVILHAIQRTAATVVGYGGVASAGTIILLACHQVVVSPFAHFLIHDGSLGTPRMKFSDALKQAKAISELYEKLARDVYGPFFTDDEITKILEGSDCYLTSEEMVVRFDAGFAKLNAEAALES